MGQTDPVLDVVDRCVGVYGSAPTCYLSVLARLDRFTTDDLDRALATNRSLIRVRAMRYSVHTFTHELLGVAFPATRTVARRCASSYRRSIEPELSRLAPAIEGLLAEGPLPGAEIRAAVDPERGLGNRFAAVLGALAADGRIVRAPATGGWRSDRLTWGLWDDWVPGPDRRDRDEAAAQRELAARYVAAYGPCERDDLQWWTGWTKAETGAASERLDFSTSGRAVDDLGGVRLLPVWDVHLVAYRDRHRLVDDPDHRFVYDRFGKATSTVTQDGRVCGIWTLGPDDARLEIKVSPLERWSAARWSAVEEQADRIGAMIGSTSVTMRRVGPPPDLVQAKRNTFLSPLRGVDGDD